MSHNPYQSPTSVFADPHQRELSSGAEANLVSGGLLYRKIAVKKPLEVTVEYFARGLRDRIIVDGQTVVSRIPILSFYERFDFSIPFRDGTLPAIVNLKTRRLKIVWFELLINEVVVFQELNGMTNTPLTLG